MEIWSGIRREMLTGALSKRAAIAKYKGWYTLKKFLAHDEPQGIERVGRAGDRTDGDRAGRPLILAEGLHGVRRLRSAVPDVPIVADLTTMDGGYLEAEMMARAGATHVVVMARAQEGSPGQWHFLKHRRTDERLVRRGWSGPGGRSGFLETPRTPFGGVFLPSARSLSVFGRPGPWFDLAADAGQGLRMSIAGSSSGEAL